jgi:hypothetical protein
MALLQGEVLNAIPNARGSGSQNAMQMQLGELAVSELLPRYAAAAWSGQVFYAANTAAQALSVASTTFTGLAVGNPAGSGKNLVIIDVTCAQAAVGAAAVMVPKLGYAATVALTTGNSTGPKGLPTLVGTGGGSVATVGASATLGAAPTIIRPLMGLQWITAGTGMWNLMVKDEIAGAIIIPPGQMLTLDSLIAAVSVIAAFTWYESPV